MRTWNSSFAEEVAEATLPALDDEFFKLFNVEEGGEEAFRAEVKKHGEGTPKRHR